MGITKSQSGLKNGYITINRQDFQLFLLGVLYLWGSSATVRVLMHTQNMLMNVYGFLFFYYGIKTFNERKGNAYIRTLGVFYLVLIFVTMVGEHGTSVMFYLFENIGVTLFINYWLHKDARKLTNALLNASIFSLIVNLLLMAVKPGGLAGAGTTAFYFLGFRIAFTPYVFVAIFLGVFLDRIDGKKMFSKKTLFVIALSVVTLLWKNVGTGLVSIVIFLGLTFYTLFLNRRIFSIWTAYIAYLAGSVAIIVFGVQNNVPILKYILEDVLGRDLTFDNRTYIWYSTLFEIYQKPWIGHGVDHYAVIFFPYSIKLLPAHNQLLCILSDAGIVGFIAFLALFIVVGISIGKLKSPQYRAIMVAAILAELMIFFTEIQMTKCLIFIVLIYAYRCKDILVDSTSNGEREI